MANAQFGFSVSSAGYLDGDGCDEVIVGAPWYDTGEAGLGWVFVYWGTLVGHKWVPFLDGKRRWRMRSHGRRRKR